MGQVDGPSPKVYLLEFKSTVSGQEIDDQDKGSKDEYRLNVAGPNWAVQLLWKSCKATKI